MTMERKIGEIFEYKGNWYQCVKGRGCDDCAFRNYYCSGKAAMGTCAINSRQDKTDVIFKKLTPVGDPYPLYGHIVQRYAGVTNPVMLPEDPFAYYNLINNTVDIEVKQGKENKEDMKANEKTITVPDGWEFDHLDERGNIVLKEKKKELPKTWAGCLRIVDDAEMIDECSDIRPYNVAYETDGGHIFDSADHNMLPLGLGKPMRALCQLLVCRNAWWKKLGWKPDWKSPEEKYCIYHSCDGVGWKNYTYDCRILAFPTPEVRDEFLDTFRDLIEEAKELL